MAKLYFKFGAMGSSKSAQALMCKFNYEQTGYKVALLKPKIDTRNDTDDKHYVNSRIGLKSECLAFDFKFNLLDYYNNYKDNIDVIIVDEAQFCSEAQVNQLKTISKFVPVLCYGLKTNFQTKLFEGSKRLVEIADSLMEIKSVCKCGSKATINARFIDGKLITEGEEYLIGGDETYKALCYNCYMDILNEKQ